MDYEYEQEQMKVKTGEDLSPEMWIMKLLLGPIDTSYDSKGKLSSPFLVTVRLMRVDETAARRY